MFEAVNLGPVTLSLFLAVIFAITRLLTERAAVKTRNGLPFPPGPPQLPLVGNALGMNSATPWITYVEWGTTYGDIIYSRLLNQDVIVINSERIARDLLEKRSHNYSDRPRLVTLELFGWTFNSAFLRYGDKWRQHRRFFNEKLRSAAALTYRPLQMRKTHQLLFDIFESPDRFAHHIQTMTASAIMSITYGYETQRRDDPLVELVENAFVRGLEVVTPEAAAVLNAWPFLLYLPSWFPGAGFKRKAQESRELVAEMIERPFRYTKSRMDSDQGTACMVSDLLDRIKNEDNYDELEKSLKDIASTTFGAASETTTSTLLNFVLAMVLYPHVQERAQAEIDSMIGNDRLVNFDDRHSLPYVEAIVREMHRWHPVVPLGLAHAAVDDDVYEGFYIPKGATVVANIWAMTRNEAKYSNPSEFIPERFFTADGKLNDDIVPYAFGFGRRICIGQYIADAGIWAAIVSMLTVFKFTRATDDQGKEIAIDPQWTSGLTARPLPFVCRIEPRSPGMTLEKLQQMISHFV